LSGRTIVRKPAGRCPLSARGKAIAIVLTLAACAFAAETPDALRIDMGVARAGEEGVRVPVLLSHREPFLAVSVSVCVDEKALSFGGFCIEGSCLEGAEGFFADWDETCGVLGVVLDLEPPHTTAAIPPQADRTVAHIVLRVRPDAPLGEAAIRLVTPAGSIGVHNVYTNPQGRDVRPALQDGGVRVIGDPPRLDAVEPALAVEGEVIRLRGEGLAGDGTLEVRIDGEPAGFRWIDETRINLQAPALGREADRIIRVCHAGGCAEASYASRPGPRFLRGDANFDARLDLADPIAILQFLFDDSAIDCADGADANDDARIDLGDAIWLLNYIFAGGPPPPPPADSAGLDPTADGLLCGS